jgi:hypothetical protein
MHSFRLTSRQRLRILVKPTRDARIVRRAVRLPELDSGMPVGEIAATLGVTRQTLYNWVKRFVKRGGLATLSDRHGRGRPSTWTEPVRLFLAWCLVSVTTTTRGRSVMTAPTRPAGFTAAWCRSALRRGGWGNHGVTLVRHRQSLSDRAKGLFSSLHGGRRRIQTSTRMNTVASHRGVSAIMWFSGPPNAAVNPERASSRAIELNGLLGTHASLRRGNSTTEPSP